MLCYVIPEPSQAGIFSMLSQLIFSRGKVCGAICLCDDKFAPSLRPLRSSAELTRSGIVCFGASRGGGQSDACFSKGTGAPPSPGGPCSHRVKRPEAASAHEPRPLSMVPYV